MNHNFTLDRSLEIPRFVVEISYCDIGFDVRMRDQLFHDRHNDGTKRYVDLKNSSNESIESLDMDDFLVLVNDVKVDLEREELIEILKWVKNDMPAKHNEAKWIICYNYLFKNFGNVCNY